MSFRKCRLAANLTLDAVAERLGVSRMAVWSWETGRFYPRVEMLKKIAALYGCTANDLLEDGDG